MSEREIWQLNHWHLPADVGCVAGSPGAQRVCLASEAVSIFGGGVCCEAHFCLCTLLLRAGTSIQRSVTWCLPRLILNALLSFAPIAPGTQPDLLLLLHAAHQSIGEWTEL